MRDTSMNALCPMVVLTMGVPLMLLLLSGVTGCVLVGPDYVAPTMETRVSEAWVPNEAEGLHTNMPLVESWWEQFEDPVLNTLVGRALHGNLDLAQARSRVREARARRGVAASARFPTVAASGSAARVKEGEQSSGGLYETGFDAAWEMDMFGRVTRQIEAATADTEAMREAQRVLRVSLLAELALNYTEYRMFAKRLELARNNIEALQQTHDLVVTRYESELANRLQIVQAMHNLASGQARVPPLEAGLERAAYRLAVLVGQRPGELAELLAAPRPVPAAPERVAIGIPADLLRRRPDLRRAERELAAQSARVGVATADLYPRFRLNGVLRFSANDTSGLSDDAARSARVGPVFSWNLFNAGSVRNNIRVQDEKQQQALLAYEQTVLLALEEAQNAMIGYMREQERRRLQEAAAVAARQAAELSESLYRQGVSDFFAVLDAQRVLIEADDRLALREAEVTANLIRLYKALGGGWPAGDARAFPHP